MPTISIDPFDFQDLLGFKIDEQALADQLDLVKGEFKGQDPDGLWRVELSDTNRPDLWSAEGIARQLRASRGRLRDYPFFEGQPAGEILVDGAMREIRPYVAAFLVRGIEVTDRGLIQLIQTQEKLAESYGSRRRDVAIGVYNVQRIHMPVSYKSVEPTAHSYIPLGFDEPMTLAEILERHPKGIEYRSILEGLDRLPLLIDRAGLTLSMPPIINSRELGEVVPGDSDLFVEATGHDLAKVVLALNIMACDLADRGGRIERVRTVYPYSTPFGSQVDVPLRLDMGLSIPVSEFSRLLGVEVTAVEVDNVLECYGCDVRREGDLILVQPPPTRADYLHPVDVIEDFAITRGYETFEPRLPRDFTPGRPAELSLLEDKVRDSMIGMGYEEIISNILLAREQIRDRMCIDPGQAAVEVDNVMNANYAVLRDSLLPCLLRVESSSAGAAYPHRLFEAGEVALFDRGASHGSRTRLHLAALLAWGEVTVSEAHADLDFLLSTLGVEWELEEASHPTFLSGRAAEVRLAGSSRPIGWLGEIHPEVLERWEIGVPVAGFEIELDAL
ncbi:MAG: phenylalanine--tRNA ligase subunit beta [Deltaproteobacteria bacterium]|nr:phenylalanine--tRNA ligase subunit beta [Deltaproteobacteria bacterium]